MTYCVVTVLSRQQCWLPVSVIGNHRSYLTHLRDLSDKKFCEETQEISVNTKKMDGEKRNHKRPRREKSSSSEDQQLKKRRREKIRRWFEEKSFIYLKKTKDTLSEDDQPGPGTSSDGTNNDNLLKRFTFHEVIGEGGFGKVLLATDSNSGKKLAIKLLKKEDLKRRNAKRILLEKEVLKIATGCPFLIHGFLTFQTKSFLCFGMDYASGGDLHDLLERRKSLATTTARFYAAEIVVGLQFLHHQGFIHRDIKPRNLLIDSAGHVRIADFGLAVRKTHGVTGYAGTVGFIAPEMLQEHPYSTGVDWYSFGVVLFCMTTGRCKYQCQLPRSADFIRDPPAKDIIEELLCEDPGKRLGANGHIRLHPFFQSTDWNKVESLQVEPPFIPSNCTPPETT